MHIIVLIFISYIGYLLVGLITKKIKGIEKAGLSFLLGLGLFTLLVFVLSTAGFYINSRNILFLIAVLLILLIGTSKVLNKRLFPGIKELFERRECFSIEKAIFWVICTILLISLLVSAYWPVSIWDALVLYDFRAKVIVETGYFVQIADKYKYFAHYPLFTSLSHVLVYLFGGTNPQYIYSLLFLSFVAIFYRAVNEFSSRKASLIATLVMCSTPILFHHSTFAYTNLPYTVYLVSGFFYLYRYLLNNKNSDSLIISALLIGLSTWTREAEPFWITSLVVLIPFAIYKKKLKHIVLYASSFFAVQYPWRIHLVNIFGKGRSTSRQISSVASSIYKNIEVKSLLEIAKFIYDSMVKQWGLFLLILFFLIVLLENRRKTRARTNVFLIIILVNFMLLVVSTYHFSLSYEGWQKIPDSARRMSMFFIPLLIFYIGTTGVFNHVFDLISFNKKHKSKRRYVGK